MRTHEIDVIFLQIMSGDDRYIAEFFLSKFWGIRTSTGYSRFQVSYGRQVCPKGLIKYGRHKYKWNCG